MTMYINHISPNKKDHLCIFDVLKKLRKICKYAFKKPVTTVIQHRVVMQIIAVKPCNRPHMQGCMWTVEYISAYCFLFFFLYELKKQ